MQLYYGYLLRILYKILSLYNQKYSSGSHRANCLFNEEIYVKQRKET